MRMIQQRSLRRSNFLKENQDNFILVENIVSKKISNQLLNAADWLSKMKLEN